jgi:hypothetical protein
MSEWSRIEGLREGEVLIDGEEQEEDRRLRMRRSLGGEGRGRYLVREEILAEGIEGEGWVGTYEVREGKVWKKGRREIERNERGVGVEG